ncbi:DUF6951 family protein [Sinanaerobacter chloroacetimidivorans]|jgi:hypothetical protein|uniref:Uncharacterized protein n=1 Tax=Sinanaerobacter chloroacetimidivorans TaxID=2818044 RepID=A0A8J8B5M7_9FIRM|nr:hypothetical protein [Sinanaerobacter chloroacetimidivorans]MBR0600490.1 hypothetical protein [Sinanaerobacter chloroacetimidivorans]
MVKVEINPGACGLKTTLKITQGEKRKLKVEIESECPQVKAMEEELTELNSITECFAKYSKSTVYQVAEKYIKHLACPVPTAIIKGMEVTAGFAAEKDVKIHIEKVL